MMDNIEFNRAGITGKELDYIKEAIDNGHTSSDGYFTKKCNEFLEKTLNVQSAILTTSCTHALELSALLLNINQGDEVILPSFTFVSTANAFVLRGAMPVFIDIRPDTLNMDESLLENLITEKTKAIIPVHYAGIGCEMEKISEIANNNDIGLIEDNAHGLFGKYKGKYLGTFGTFSTLSFHDTKNFSSGEGGALIINDAKYNRMAGIISQKGTNRKEFYEKKVCKYTWVSLGSSYLPSDMLAAFLLAQFEEKENIIKKRKSIWEFYYNNLSDWAFKNGIRLPFIPDYCEHTYHIFYMIMPDNKSREELILYLKKLNIQATFHFQPLHSSEIGLTYGGKPGQCPVSENISDCLVRLPLHYFLSLNDIDRIVSSVLEFKI